MKVLHIVPTLSTDSLQYGGPSVATLEMCIALAQRGIRVEIIATHENRRKRGTFSERLGVNGEILVHYFPKHLNGPFFSGFGFSPLMGRWLDQHVNEFDLADIHTLFNYPSTKGCLSCIRWDIPYILRPCGMLDKWCLQKSRLKKAIWMLAYGRRNLNKAAALHFTSDDEKKSADALCIRTPAIIVPLGVAIDRKDETIGQSPLIIRLRQSNGKKKILFLSRVHPKKGLDLLMPALKHLAKKRDDFILILAGSGEPKHEAYIKHLLGRYNLDRQTIITGFVAGLDKEALFSLCDIFILPSYSENFGLAAVEAMSRGLPVIISDQVNIHHDVRAYNAGMVTACDIEGVAGAIERLLDNDALRKEMGRNGERLTREKFSWDIIIPEMIRLYEHILKEKAKIIAP